MSNSIKIEKDIKDGVLVGVQVIEETENSTSHHYIFSDLPETATDEEIAVVMTEKLGFNPFEDAIQKWRSTASLTRRKFMLGIKFYPHGEGTLASAINALRDGLQEPTKTIIGTSLDESTHFDRNDPDLIAMGTAIGMNADQIDEFYKWADNEQWRNVQ